MALFVLSVYVSPQILPECKFELIILLVKLYQVRYKQKLRSMDESQVGLFVLSVYVSPQILPDPPSVLSWGPNSSLPQTGGPARRDAPRLLSVRFLSKLLAKLRNMILHFD